MNLFVCGIGTALAGRSEEVAATFGSYLDEIPFLERDRLRLWVSSDAHVVAACVSHREEQLGGVVPSCFEADRMVLYGGRPIIRGDEGNADGRAPLDPRFFFGPTEAWVHRLDGRAVVVRFDEVSGELSICTDPLGSYPVYRTDTGGIRWFGNNVELLTRVTGCSRSIDPERTAAFMGCGFSLGGHPLAESIHRLPRGVMLTLRNGSESVRELLPTEAIGQMFTERPSLEDARRALVGVTTALGDWPLRPTYVSLTGGRDSRLVFAAALNDGLEFSARTVADPQVAGFPDTPDVVVARSLCNQAGVRHVVRIREPGASLASRLRILRLISPGTVALGEIGRIPVGESEDPIEIDIGGQGGELARDYYHLGGYDASEQGFIRELQAHLIRRYPLSILTAEGEDAIHRYLLAWVREQRERGVALGDLADVFYLFERMGNWASQIGAVGEYWRDAASPLWTAALLRHEFGMPLEERRRDGFHGRLLETLNPALYGAAFAGAQSGWSDRRWVVAARKVAEEATRQAMTRLPARSREPAGDELGDVIRQVQESVHARPDHPCWEVVSRPRVLRLLRQNPRALHRRSRAHVLRLASLLLP
jgi:hypothetical protein